MENEGCLTKIMAWVFGGLIGLLVIRFVYGLIDGLILEITDSQFLAAVLLIISCAIKSILTYLIFGGLICPKYDSVSTAINYPGVFKTIVAVIVSLFFALFGFVMSWDSLPNKHTALINSEAMQITLLAVLAVTTIVTAIIRFHSIANAYYQER